MQILLPIGGQDDPRTRNITYGHHIYNDGYRYQGSSNRTLVRPRFPDFKFWRGIAKENGIGWGSILRTGNLNEDGSGQSSVSNGVATDYFSIRCFQFSEISCIMVCQ